MRYSILCPFPASASARMPQKAATRRAGRGLTLDEKLEKGGGAGLRPERPRRNGRLRNGAEVRACRQSMIPPDVNVLLYAFRKDVAHHRNCKPWHDSNLIGDAAFAVSRLVLGAVVRIATNGRAYAVPSSLEDTYGFCELHQAIPCAHRRGRDPTIPTTMHVFGHALSSRPGGSSRRDDAMLRIDRVDPTPAAHPGRRP